MSLGRLQDCCSQLNSPKVSERKKGADNLDSLLEDEAVLGILNEGRGPVGWNDLLRSVHYHYVKESENQMKKNARKCSKIDMLVNVVKKANKGALRLISTNLIQYVLQCFTTESLQTHYLNAYIIILKDHILSQPAYLGSIDPEDWMTLLDVFKRFILRDVANNSEDMKIAECLRMILTHGPRNQLPLERYRDQFDLVTRLGKNLKTSLPTRYKTEVLRTVIDFLVYNASDCCVSCCKLAEDVFVTFRALYERRASDSSVKDLLFEFYLMDIKLHHPCGVEYGNSAALAYNSHEWQKQLFSIYKLVHQELVYQTKEAAKSKLIFDQSNSFVLLTVAVCKQIFSSNFNSSNLNMTIDDMSSFDISQPSKKAKLETGFDEFLSDLKHTKSYPMIFVVTEMLGTYPEIITFEESVQLLDLLVNMYKESKVKESYLYDCLIVLLDLQTERFRDRMAEVDRQWGFIADEMPKYLGLHQNAVSIHKLLRRLIDTNKITDFSLIHQTFLSGTLTVDTHVIETLFAVLNHTGFPELNNQESSKSKLVKWLLNYDEKNPKVFSGDKKLFAKTLVSLCLKQSSGKQIRSQNKQKNIQDFEEVYLFNSFKKLISLGNKPTIEKNNNTLGYRQDIYIEIVKAVNEFLSNFIYVNHNNNHLQNTLSALSLVGWILTELISFENLDVIIQRCSIPTVFESLNEMLLCACEYNGRKNSFLETLNLFNKLLKAEYDSSVNKRFRNYVSQDVLGVFFELLNSEENNKEETNVEDISVKQMSMDILSNFAMYKGNEKLSEVEQQIIEEISKCSHEEYEILMMVFRKVKDCTVGALNENILASIMESLLEIWRHRSNERLVVLNILEICCGLVDHIGVSPSEHLIQKYYTLLMEIYKVQDHYGYEVSLALLSCYMLIFQGNYYINHKRYLQSSWSAFICSFLKSDYQLVRLKAIECHVVIFDSNFTNPVACELQKSILDVVGSTSRDVFTIRRFAGDLNQERENDETVSRTSSVLQTYGSLMVLNCGWRKSLLYQLVCLAVDKGINRELLAKALNLIASELSYPSVDLFFKDNIRYMLSRWCENSRKLSDFPWELCECGSYVDFLRRYIMVIVPLQFNKNLDEISEQIGMSRKELFENGFSQLVTMCFLRKDHLIYSNLADELPKNQFQELLIKNVDQVIINVLTCVIDGNLYEKQFGMKYPFESDVYSDAVIKEIFNEINLKLAFDLVAYCVKEKPSKMQSILLQLTVKIYDNRAQDKLRSLHQYLNFVKVLKPFIEEPNNKISGFCIQTITYTLLYFAEMECPTKLFNIASLEFLQSFIRDIVSQSHEEFKDLFVVVINKLNFFLSISDLSKISLEILNILIVENTEKFNDLIPTLDPLLSLNSLSEINVIYETVCLEKWGSSLKGRINRFLTSRENSNPRCLEALRGLKQTLSEKKNELKVLFEETRDVRDFSEERKGSITHRLICSLLELLSFDCKETNLEAACCLGQIGASNLTTLILQSEDIDSESTLSPYELLVSYVVTSSYQRLINQDIHIAKNAGFILYEILNTKEGYRFLRTTDDIINSDYIYPFLPLQKKLLSASITIIDTASANTINNSSLWWYSDGEHKSWIMRLVCAFLNCFPKSWYFPKLISLCEIDVLFCEKLLPYLIHLYASLQKSNVEILSKHINYFFDRVFKLSLESNGIDSVKTSSVHCLLDAILFSRINQKKQSCQYDLQLDYLKLAQASFYCSRFFDAIFYIEMWCQLKAEAIDNTKKFIGSSFSLWDLVCGNEDFSICLITQKILRKSYSAVGEADGLNGCGHAFLLDTSTRLDHYKESGRWDQVVLHIDASLAENGLAPGRRDFAEALMNCGYYTLASSYHERAAAARAPDYDILWRLGRWRDAAGARRDVGDPYERNKYLALRSLLEGDTQAFATAVSEARLAAIESCRGVEIQTTQALYGVLLKLRMLQELEDMDGAPVDRYVGRWREQDAIPNVDFARHEPIKAQRIAVLKGFVNRSESGGRRVDTRACKELLADLYLDLAACAREEKQFNIAKLAIMSLSAISDLSEEYSAKKILEEGKICWAMEDKITARCLIRQLFVKDDDKRLKFASLKLYGQWMAESQSENSQTILNTYFLGSLKMMNDVEKNKDDLENIYETHYEIARFADLEYQRIRAYVKSVEFERKISNKEKSRAAAEKLRAQGSMQSDADQKRAYMIYHKQSVIDEAEIESTLNEQAIYLELAIKYYMLNLQYSDANDTRIFRVLSLWLENRNSDKLKKLLDDKVSKIPSRKFVSILPQLVPHLSNNPSDDFAGHIASIIERCAVDHPHQTLPILLSLSNANIDESYAGGGTTTDSNETRVEGAQNLLKKLSAERPDVAKTATELQFLSEALVELAYLDRAKCKPARGKAGTYVVPGHMKILKVKDLAASRLPTSRAVSIRCFKGEFNDVGGVNQPKSVLCACSDGATRRLLVKGKDDLRQDAVMQQVFTIMNDLFRNNKHTSKLLIRTYKVVPLSKRSGILEWVENCPRIGEELTRLHHTYRPKDWNVSKCQIKIKSASGRSGRERDAAYAEVCRHFAPTMHRFFTERYPGPCRWYERRRAFARSLATSSICGYVLGLGDRHGGNVLLDGRTAEVVHIDFGVAFEQGRLLPTPETVPFRLTRDLEDGLGATGVNGVFKRSCEKTMQVLRENWETIASILEVLLYDPLYAWTVTPAEAYSRQHFDDDTTVARASIGFGSDDRVNINVTAERALLRLCQKLHGTEEGKSSSVEGQVEKLIQQARDPANLSRLFYGWQAFL